MSFITSVSLCVSSRVYNVALDFESYFLLNLFILYGLPAAPIIYVKVVEKGMEIGCTKGIGQISSQTQCFMLLVTAIASDWTSIYTDLRIQI